MKSSWMGGMKITEVRKEEGENRGREDKYGLKTRRDGRRR